MCIRDRDTRSAIALRYDDGQRLIQLLHGRILVATAPDPARAGWPARPLLVDTARGRLRPLGTRFVAQHLDDADLVAVLEGAVEILPRDAPAATRIVRAGEQSHYSRPVSYTHLDVYKRQHLKILEGSSGQIEEWLTDSRVDIAILYRYGDKCPPGEQALASVDSYPVSYTHLDVYKRQG